MKKFKEENRLHFSWFFKAFFTFLLISVISILVGPELVANSSYGGLGYMAGAGELLLTGTVILLFSLLLRCFYGLFFLDETWRRSISMGLVYSLLLFVLVSTILYFDHNFVTYLE